jgi:hypothetical protein
MKNISLLALSLLIISTTTGLAQKTIDGRKISKDAKAGLDIVYENVTVRGVIDFTNYSTEVNNLPEKSWRWWGSGSTKKDERMINGKITFRNCIFNDDVIAYILANDEYLFTASFANDVIFENCTFNNVAAFKYSTFERKAIFRNSRFDEEMNFKYAEFNREADFTEILSNDDANFKYAKFNRHADFSASKVRHEANFKYTKFNKGLSIHEADFGGLLNFKYAQITGEFNSRNAMINDIDTKYAKVNGSSFTKHLLTSSN